METNEKGCVYFFRHIGLTPVKIGYSTHESPIGRFEQFKTYAPYGSEILGFIRTSEAKQLETTLHERFSQYRLNGEWFEITSEQCDSVISFYSNIEDIKEKNEFQIAWAMKVQNALGTELKDNNTTIELFRCFNIWLKTYNFEEKLQNNDFFKYINSISKSFYHIKTIKKELRMYCKRNDFYIIESASNGNRLFYISKKK